MGRDELSGACVEVVAGGGGPRALHPDQNASRNCGGKGFRGGLTKKDCKFSALQARVMAADRPRLPEITRIAQRAAFVRSAEKTGASSELLHDAQDGCAARVPQVRTRRN
jgi:hypothetical protein